MRLAPRPTTLAWTQTTMNEPELARLRGFLALLPPPREEARRHLETIRAIAFKSGYGLSDSHYRCLKSRDHLLLAATTLLGGWSPPPRAVRERGSVFVPM